MKSAQKMSVLIVKYVLCHDKSILAIFTAKTRFGVPSANFSNFD